MVEQMLWVKAVDKHLLLYSVIDMQEYLKENKYIPK